jgi:hypothetical protein
MLYNQDGDDPPVALDLNESDRWFFQELAWSTATMIHDQQTGELQSDATAKALLLFSYKPDPTQVALGNESGEALISRVIETKPLTVRPDTILSAGNRAAAQFDGTADHYLDINPTGAGGAWELIPDADRTLEYWAKRDASTNSPTADRVIYEQSGLKGLLQTGFRGPDHGADPGGFFLDAYFSNPTNFMFNEDFSSGAVPSGATLYGTAAITNGVLVLAEDTFNQHGTILLEDLAGGLPVTNLTATFKFRISDITDGMSFNFAPDLPDGNVSASGEGTGLSVIFEAFPGARLKVKYNGVELANQFYFFGDFLTDTNFEDVVISLDPDGLVDVTFGPMVSVTDVATPFVSATGWRIGIGARNGGADAAQYIDDLAISLDATFVPSVPTISVDVPGVEVDDRWHHWALTTTATNELSIYMDGRLLRSSVEAFTLGSADYTLTRMGQSAERPFGPMGELDHFRIWSRTLTTEEVRSSMVNRTPSSTANLQINADFDTTLTTQSGSNGATLSTPASDPNDLLAFSADGPHEVATRIISKVDTAGFDSGYIMNRISNYNSSLYARDDSVGTWGPIFPVNWSGLFSNSNRRLEIAYYDNPYQSIPFENSVLHPNVAWPSQVLQHNTVEFPAVREHKDKRIYIAGRLGTEGVDATGADQLVFDPAEYEGLAVYNQPDQAEPGFNPNEEHALVEGSIKDQLTGNDQFNLGQSAAFALQRELNRTDPDPTTYSSDPWVLVEYRDIEADEWQMAAYRVEDTRAGTALFPALDPVTHEPLNTFGQPVAQPSDPMYDFDYPSFAGDILIPPYPLNTVIGNVMVSQNRGGNIQVGGVNHRTLWKDKNLNAWVVSGDGRFFYQYWYPMRDDFWFDTGTDNISDLNTGTPVAWLPGNKKFIEADGNPKPVKVRYSTYWRSGYPVIKRGETLTHLGGENKADNPAGEGLPALVAFASAQIIFDSRTPEMTFDTNNVSSTYSARVVRPLDRIEARVDQADMPEHLTPAFTDNIMVDGARWHFKALTGSLQKRIYYDSLLSKLVFRGRLNDLQSGDPDLTSTPIASYILEPNTLTKSEYTAVRGLAESDGVWTGAVGQIYQTAQNPHGSTNANATTSTDELPVYFSGIENYQSNVLVDIPFYTEVDTDPVSTPGSEITATNTNFESVYQPLNSLGVGSALAPHPGLLTETNAGPFYVTLVENNHADVGGAVSLHIVRISDNRFRGSIKVVEAQDVFDEKINLRHTGDFGGNTEEVYYQWWVREVAGLDTIALPTDEVEWQIYEEGLGLHQIEFSGRPDIVLADKFFYVRYGEKNELLDIGDAGNVITNDLEEAVTTPESWRLVDINSSVDTYARMSGDPVPFQWAGAANSPQLQADGSKRYIPQLVMGWVKRVLDRINPFEARFSDFFNNESPATYSSMIQIAGRPFNGKVALNSDKNVIENVGLIELYETVLARARELTLDIDGAATDGTNQALLLAATRLGVLYELLAREAYSDAQNPLVRVTDENGLDGVASFVHAFRNSEPSLLHEEMALLRGTDFLKAYPAFNRLFWNYVKGLGEAAYNANYNIHDENLDGFINEFDAAALYPHGHGDAWGHFLSSNKMHYELLRNNAFDWLSRSELYSLLDNVIEADYLDEQSFARIAAAKARAGVEIVRGTYRLAYVEDPEGQWQGYTDPNTPRAWGVSEWGKRAGHGALYDWMVGNALVPEYADETSTNLIENLDQIDRRANRSELAEIASASLRIQQTLDQANIGSNPLGLDQDALVFDLDPQPYDGDPVRRATHFDQILERALFAADNALAAQAVAARAENQLQRIADDTSLLQGEAVEQDLDFRNRLIAIFGTPYDGTIGPGQIFAEGYTGPDTLLYLYIDRTATGDLIPTSDDRYTRLLDVSSLSFSSYRGIADDFSDVDWETIFPIGAPFERTVDDIFDEFYLSTTFPAASLSNKVEAVVTGDFGFQVPDADGDGEPDWGRRAAYGRIQMLLNEMLAAEITYLDRVSDYGTFLQELVVMNNRLIEELEIEEGKALSRARSTLAIVILEAFQRVSEAVAAYSSAAAEVSDDIGDILNEYLPRIIGLSSDATSAARGAIKTTAGTVKFPSLFAWKTAEVVERVADAGIRLAEAGAEHDQTRFEELSAIMGLVSEIGEKVASEEGFRLAIGEQKQRLELLGLEFRSTIAEGFRLLEERESFNTTVAGLAQRNRYQDMMLRLARNDALIKYQDAFENALRYAWLATKAYDYETSLSEGHPANPGSLLEEIVRTRVLGQWENDEPVTGEGGVAGVLARLKSNFDTLDGQLGINNPQMETGQLSLRHEHFRIDRDTFANGQSWREVLRSAWVDDLWGVTEYRRFCRPVTALEDGPLPGLVIEFRTEIQAGRNVFGRRGGGGDHAYSTANFATKIRSVGAWFENYNEAGLFLTPRIFLVPAGVDVLRTSDGLEPELRTWNVVEQAIPVPFILNQDNLTDPGFIPSIHSFNGSFAQIRRHGDFRAYHATGETAIDPDEMNTVSRLIGRSVWNTKWLLIIPGTTLHNDPELGLNRLIGDDITPGISDIRLVFETVSHEGI